MRPVQMVESDSSAADQAMVRELALAAAMVAASAQVVAVAAASSTLSMQDQRPCAQGIDRGSRRA
jgi:hypothetical protein